MEAERWQRMWDLFHEARGLPAEDREAFLAGRCEAEPELAREVQALLGADTLAIQQQVLATPLAGLDDVPADDLLGSEIGPYQLQAVLGEGGMGIVYLAVQQEPLERVVALKLIRLGMNSREVVARFEGERQTLARMSHPGIAKVFDAGIADDGRPFFVMERVDGAPIHDYAREHRLDLEARIHLFVRVCRAVEHAHQKGVLHRDLKPSNILVSDDGGTPRPTVIDFGVAKAIDHRLAQRALSTRLGRWVGTPEFMSPEQAAMSHDIDTRSDVYSLGVVLYELLAGEPPFDFREASYGEMQRALQEDEPPRPSSRVGRASPSAKPDRAALARSLAGDLDWIVMKALEKDRERRYGSAAALADDLEKFLVHEPVSAGPPSRRYRLAKLVRRNRLAVAAAGVAVLSLVLGLAGTGWMAVVAERQRQEAVTAREEAEAARDRAERETELARASQQFLVDMLGAADPRSPAALVDVPRDIRVVQVLDYAAATLEEAFADRPEVEASLRTTLGTTYRSLGLFEEAEPQLEAARSRWREAAGAADPRLIEAELELAVLRSDLGRFEEVETLGVDLLERSRQALGDDHPLTLRIRVQLTDARFEQGLLDDPVTVYRNLLDDTRRALGEDHPTTLLATNNLAVILNQRGHNEESVAVYRQAAARHREVLGDDHPDTLLTLNNLASALVSNGSYAEAEALFRETHATQSRVLGARNSDTLQTLANLGVSLFRQEKWVEAEAIWSETLAGYEETLEPNHPLILVSTANLARVTQDLGRLAEAEALYRRLIAGAERALPPKHINVAVFQGGMGVCLTLRGKYAEAERYLQSSHDALHEALGPEHRRSVMAVERLAELYEAWGRTDDAERYRQRLPAAG